MSRGGTLRTDGRREHLRVSPRRWRNPLKQTARSDTDCLAAHRLLRSISADRECPSAATTGRSASSSKAAAQATGRATSAVLREWLTTRRRSAGLNCHQPQFCLASSDPSPELRPVCHIESTQMSLACICQQCNISQRDAASYQPVRFLHLPFHDVQRSIAALDAQRVSCFLGLSHIRHVRYAACHEELVIVSLPEH